MKVKITRGEIEKLLLVNKVAFGLRSDMDWNKMPDDIILEAEEVKEGHHRGAGAGWHPPKQKEECDKCGRTSEVVNMKDCPFCSPKQKEEMCTSELCVNFRKPKERILDLQDNGKSWLFETEIHITRGMVNRIIRYLKARE